MPEVTFFHDLKDVAKTRGHRATILTPQTLIFSNTNMDGHSFFVKNQVFYRNFISSSDSMTVVN